MDYNRWRSSFNTSVDSLVAYTKADSGGFAGKMMRKWRLNLISLEEDFQNSLMKSAWDCKDDIRLLSQDLLAKLINLEDYMDTRQSVDDDDFFATWMKNIKTWKRNVYRIKCELKDMLRDLIREHYTFLTKLNQYHPEYIKWKISRIVMETNKIIQTNETAFEITELDLIQSANTFLKHKHNNKKSQIEELDTNVHDAIRLNYDELELEEERKRKGDLLIEPLEEVRLDSSLTTLLEWLNKLKDMMVSEPLPAFKVYDSRNKNLETALSHMENCKNVVISSALDFMYLVEPHMKDEFQSINKSTVELLNSEERYSLERWMECVSIFEYCTKRTLSLLKISADTWNHYVCRLETVRKLIENILKNMLAKQNQHQIKIEQKINVFLDGIREAADQKVIENCVQNITKNFAELEKLFSRSYEAGVLEVQQFSIGCKNARNLFCSHAGVFLAKEFEPLDFPDHGSEQDVTIEAVTGLHHWEVIKHSFNSYANWHLGVVEGINQLCLLEKDNDDWGAQGEEEMIRQLAWIKDVKEQALNQRKKRFHADLVMPRIKELESHDLILSSHIKGLEKIFTERGDWIEEFKSTLLTMASKLNSEYEAIIDLKSLSDVYARCRYIGRINNFEIELQKTEEKKTFLCLNELNKIKNKYMWLQRANYKILSCIRLFNEGGSFSPSQALEFSKKVSQMQSEISKEEKTSISTFNNVAKSINPTKNINTHVLTGIKQMLYYKTKKDSVEDIANAILNKVKELIQIELTRAKNICIELCDVLGCSAAPLLTIQELLTKMALYLRFPQESLQLECEDFNYMKDFSTEIDVTNDLDNQDDSKTETKASEEKQLDGKELTEVAQTKIGSGHSIRKGKKNPENAEDSGKKIMNKNKENKKSHLDYSKKDKRAKDGVAERQSSKKSSKSAEINAKDPTLAIERENVLRDTKCEQDQRKQLLEQKSNEEDDSDLKIKESKVKTRLSKGRIKKATEKNKRNNGKVKSEKEKISDKGSKPHESGTEEKFMPQVKGDLEIDLAGNYLFKYTRTPIIMDICNYLLSTKMTIHEHFIQIQRISEKFFLSEHPTEIKKVWPEFSPRSDFEILTSRVLKGLRILNIHCEHSWIILVHDFLCMVRVLHNVTEDGVGKELKELQSKWKRDFSKVCCESEAALTHVVQSKKKKAARLLNNFSFSNCKDSAGITMNDEILAHCNQHVEDIKIVWSDFTKGILEKYKNYKESLEEFIERTENMRQIISSEEIIWSCFKSLHNFANRFDITISNFLTEVEKVSHEDLSEKNETTKLYDSNQNMSDMAKLKTLKLLLEVILCLIENFENNYRNEEQEVSRDTSYAAELNTTKVDVRNQTNSFLQEILKKITYKHGCFRRICSDQISITIKWLHHWQNEIGTEEATEPNKL